MLITTGCTAHGRHDTAARKTPPPGMYAIFARDRLGIGRRWRTSPMKMAHMPRRNNLPPKFVRYIIYIYLYTDFKHKTTAQYDIQDFARPQEAGGGKKSRQERQQGDQRLPAVLHAVLDRLPAAHRHHAAFRL